MDKYEYNLKLEEIDKLVDQGDYEEAASLADTIDWRRVRNTRTLCLISEIYEASGRLEDSKKLLMRAYRKTPVGRNVLYRLVEVLTALGQYDEALEYYSEYVQAAPHDNNRYILKYMIYRGRGSSVEEQIAILEEYLGQEYTERWAYELAKLYQQSGQMQKCFAACDDLVLWFHSGKYVKKALELKMRYTSLTPKQQQIYEECRQEAVRQDTEDDADETVLQGQKEKEIDSEVIAESIMAETEKTIAGNIAAQKAELDKEASRHAPVMPGVEEIHPGEPSGYTGAGDAAADGAAGTMSEIPGGGAGAKAGDSDDAAGIAAGVSHDAAGAKAGDSDNVAGIAAGVSRDAAGAEAGGSDNVARNEAAGMSASGDFADADSRNGAAEDFEGTDAVDTTVSDSVDAAAAAAASDAAQKDLQVELAKSMRRIISGVVKRTEENEDDIPAGVEARIQKTQHLTMPENVEPAPAQLSIDDILLSMGEKGKKIAAEAMKAEAQKKAAEEEARQAEEARIAEERAREAEQEQEEALMRGPKRTAADDATDDLTDAQREALSYTSNPERLLRNRSSLPTYFDPADEDLGKTRRAFSREELRAVERELLAEKTIRIPTEEIARRLGQPEDGEGFPETDMRDTEEWQPQSDSEADSWEDAPDQILAEDSGYPEDKAFEADGEASDDMTMRTDGEASDDMASGADGKASGDDAAEDDASGEFEEYYDEDSGDADGEYLTIPEHLRALFGGFTEVEGLEDQIANAIIQAEAKGSDRTSRSGNILIFGAHGSGKTTLAMNIAKAIAQDRGSQVMKMARIYAADLNRKDIAATVARIAGGTLIIEEAGDLEPNTVEQLTTAMEFRTDGLIVILEDEQQYIHDLLMRHPRFTMKFTAQIYLPSYTPQELIGFGQIYANEQDFVISDEAAEALEAQISAAKESGTAMTISDVIGLVGKAIERSNKFFRKLSMGKKRYDENDYVILFAKDFK